MTKGEILHETLLYLRDNKFTTVDGIRANIFQVLEERGIVGEIMEGNRYFSTTKYVEMSNEVALLIEEVIWDLIVERILTPGRDRANLGLPWLHVSNEQKLNNALRA